MLRVAGQSDDDNNPKHQRAPGADGLPDAKSIGDADYIGRVVFRLLDPVEQGLDLAEVTIKLLQGTSGCSDL